MEFKGTKGKWVVRENQRENSNGFIVISIGDFQCTYYGRIKMENEDFSEETKANALLISKAPEMLEMLKTIVSEFSIYKSAHGTSKCGAILRTEELIEEVTSI